MSIRCEIFGSAVGYTLTPDFSERGFKAWEEDLLGMGEVSRRKRRERDCWAKKGERRMLFESDEERARSGVRSHILEAGDGYVEEVLSDEKQPWES
jgi:hypothetical protein